MGKNFSIDDIGQDTLDSSEVQKLYDDLTSEEECLAQAIKDARADLKLVQGNGGPAEGDDELDEALTALEEAEQELEHFHVENSDLMRDIEDAMEQVSEEWRYGIGLIHERHWVDFVREDMEEMGYINKDAWWIEIDWEATAKNIAVDYITIELGDHTYYVRSC